VVKLIENVNSVPNRKCENLQQKVFGKNILFSKEFNVKDANTHPVRKIENQQCSLTVG